MLRSLYISKTGMDSSQFKLDVVTNNLANTNTTAFKKVLPDVYKAYTKQITSRRFTIA